ncbi:MAG: adenylate kinase family protein [Candidatus Woesearchaeota archaeon]|jgi:adenylate kinase|nr:adenylate kinase family protein [Candidatus Woesearchaeota archaeon]
MKVIAISGTPGTGKTTLAKKLSKKLSYPILDVKKFIKSKKLSESYDKKRKTNIIDTSKLNKELIKEINKVKKEHNPKGIIIDSHLSHYLPKKQVTLCIITKCNLKTLNTRLKKRRYSKLKIRENLDAEIFDTCHIEAKEKQHNTIVITTTNALNMNNISKKIK